MSIWSSCDGIIKVNKNCGFSLRKYLNEDWYDEYSVKIEQEENIINFKIIFSLEGMGAAVKIQGLVYKLLEVKGVQVVELNSEIRWF